MRSAIFESSMEELSPNQSYHVIKFEDINEASAFLAALSRFLNYPQGIAYRSQNEPIEILLSASAYDTATIAFTPFPATSLVDIWIDWEYQQHAKEPILMWNYIEGN